MALNKPFKRIARENLSQNQNYVTDSLYSLDRLSFIHSYYLIEQDLKKLFDYVSPNNLNLNTFSHRIYEIFFRCCTEFENNASAILTSNGYSHLGNMNIKDDYFKINKALKLHDFEVRINVWENGPLILKPFLTWNSSTFSSLNWYRDYNSVKHSRTQNFTLANLDNLINSAAGLFILLFAQYNYHAFSPYQRTNMIDIDTEFVSANNCLFGIKPAVWPDSEKYDFDWNVLKTTTNPFNNFPF